MTTSMCHCLKDTLKNDNCHEWASGLRVVSCVSFETFGLFQIFCPEVYKQTYIFPLAML